MIRCVLLDFDGVLRSWDGAGVDAPGIEDECGFPPGTLRATAFAADLVGPAVTGQVSDEEWRRQVADRLALQFPAADAERLVAAWSASPGEVDREVLALVRECRARVKVCLLTNATSLLPSHLERLGLVGELDYVVNSSEVGVAKPDAGVYEAALRLVGVRAEEALFVDDTPSHIAGAKRLGIEGHVFGGAGPLRDWLNELGVLAFRGERAG